jgi:NAD(P)-dependent dehydrogenase (short-subunit alcohol dehydrogenase family)
MIDLGLEDKRAIVVGAGFQPERAGHGRGTALNLAAAGATVACVDMDRGRADAIVREIADKGGKAFAVVGDVATSVGARAAIDEARDALGGIDICVDIVGEARWSLAEETTDDQWEWSIRHNITQVMYVYRAAVAHMIPQGTGGALAAIASVDGIGASAYHLAYGVAKAGVISLTRTFAEEMGPFGIRVNAVAPGNVGGGVWDAPVPEFGSNSINPLAPPRPQDVADGLLFLCSSLAQRVTGHTLVVDGGALAHSPWGFTKDSIAQLVGRLPGAWED